MVHGNFGFLVVSLLAFSLRIFLVRRSSFSGLGLSPSLVSVFMSGCVGGPWGLSSVSGRRLSVDSLVQCIRVHRVVQNKPICVSASAKKGTG